MTQRPSQEALRAWHDELQREVSTHPQYREWMAVRELLDLGQPVISENLAAPLSERARKVRAKEQLSHSRKQANSDLKEKCLRHSVEI